MPQQDTAILAGSPANFAEAVRQFAEQRRQAAQEAPYVLRPEPMPADPAQVLCLFGPGHLFTTGTITAQRAAKDKTNLTVDASAEAWPAVKRWWLLLREHLDRDGWLYRGVDQPSRKQTRDAEMYDLHQSNPRYWNVQRLSAKYDLKTARIYQILRAQEQRARGAKD